MALFGVIALFGFYMSLGPSVKLFTHRPDGMDQLMPKSFELFSTGNAWLSEKLPGFKNMRASYRWLALGIFGCWAIIAMMLASKRFDHHKSDCAACRCSIQSSHCWALFATTINRSDMYSRNAVVQELDSLVKKGETIAFLPFRNDFLVNFVASILNVRTYNIGGDKNLASAWEILAGYDEALHPRRNRP